MPNTFQIRSLEEYEEQYRESVAHPEAFWAGIAEHFNWKKKWDKVLDWNFNEPSVKWFEGAELNITENCLDRHLVEKGDVPAIIWEPNDPTQSSRTLSYKELHFEVCLFAQMLRDRGITKGDRVCIYMCMIPELVISVLACARIGAIHSVIFGGFSARSIADRVQDAGAVCMITADGAWRGAKEIPLKPVVDEALKECPTIKKVLVLKHTKTTVNMTEGRDEWIGDALKTVDAAQALKTPAAIMNSEDPLFILYTSGSTGKPKGVVHTCGGYMVYTTYSFVNVFQYQPGDVYFCTADVGWVTGHSYIVYGPLCAGATVLLFEGVPTWPDAGRFWEIVDKYKVNILYTAPTAIRSLMTYGLDPLKGKNLSSLKVLGTVGEPINEEAWHWYHEHIGRGNCPIVDTWWQTETGGILISNLAGITPAKPAHATLPLPGVQPCLMDEKGNEIVFAMASPIPSKGGEYGETPSANEGKRFSDNDETSSEAQVFHNIPSPLGRLGGALEGSGEAFATANPFLYPVLREYADLNKKNETQAERILWELLRNKQLNGYKFRRQHIISRYIADFVCLRKGLIIELDGKIHQHPENKESDNERTRNLNELGFEVLRFSNDRLIDNPKDVLNEILVLLDSLSTQRERIVASPIPSKGGEYGETHPANEEKPLTDLDETTSETQVFHHTSSPMDAVQRHARSAMGGASESEPLSGNLCIKFPWPSMLRTTWGDHERCRTTYFTAYPGKYFTGDGALLDSDGNYRITGRVDDVLNVSGHRIGTAEVENAINEHHSVFESAVVGYPHDIKGQGIYAFVVASAGHPDDINKEIMATVTELIGPFARPDKIQLVSGLPKTRSGKIMRRILRKIAEGDVSNLGDTSTLLDPAVVEEIVKGSGS